MLMGIAQMSSLLSSQNTLKNLSGMNATGAYLEGQTNVLTSEIETDKGRGIDTSKKEETLADTKERLDTLSRNIGNSIADHNEQMTADKKKIRKEEDKYEHAAQKAEQETATSGAKKSGRTMRTDATDTTVAAYERADVMKISPEAKETTSRIEQIAVPTPSIQVPTTGKFFDKKV